MRNRAIYRLDTQADLEHAVKKLTRRDPRLRPILEQAGMPQLRRRPAGLPGLAAIVVGQQLSIASASAIWSRLEIAFDPFHHDALLRSRADRLARLGLSAAKIKTLKHIAQEIAEKRLDLDALADADADADADEAHRILTSLHGVGPWTADIYLLFCLGHGDAWPAGDLAVQEAMRIGLNLTSRPTAKEMNPLAEDWRPFRGVAAHLWWAYYKVARKRDGAPVPESVAGVGKISPTPRASCLKPSSPAQPEPVSDPAPTATGRRTKGVSRRPRT